MYNCKIWAYVVQRLKKLGKFIATPNNIALFDYV